VLADGTHLGHGGKRVRGAQGRVQLVVAAYESCLVQPARL
jgi:hypothetical protein